MSNKKGDFTIWASENGREFFPAKSTFKNLDPGYYSIKYSNDTGYYLEKKELSNNDYVDLSYESFSRIVDAESKFWPKKEEYNSLSKPFVKGVLLEGAPGNGKTFLLRKITKSAIENKRLVIKVDDPEDCKSFIPAICSVEKDREIILIIDKIDFMAEKFGFFPIIDMLDSLRKQNGIFYIATANSTDRLIDALYHSPSGFDSTFEVDYPDDKLRNEFIKTKLSKLEKTKVKPAIKKWVAETDGMSLAHIDLLISSVVINEEDFNDKVAEIKAAQSKVSPDTGQSPSLGY